MITSPRVLARLLFAASRVTTPEMRVAAATPAWKLIHEAADRFRPRAQAITLRAFNTVKRTINRKTLELALEKRDDKRVLSIMDGAIEHFGSLVKKPIAVVLADTHAAAGHATVKRLAQELRAAGFNPDEPRGEDGKWTDGGGGGTTNALPTGGKAQVVKGNFDINKIEGARRIMVHPETLETIVGPDMDPGSPEFMDATHAQDFEDALGVVVPASAKNTFDDYVRGFIGPGEIQLFWGDGYEDVDPALKFDAYSKVLEHLVKTGGATKDTDVVGVQGVVKGRDTQKLGEAFPFLFKKKKRNLAFNPDEPRDETGKWTGGGEYTSELNRENNHYEIKVTGGQMFAETRSVPGYLNVFTVKVDVERQGTGTKLYKAALAEAHKQNLDGLSSLVGSRNKAATALWASLERNGGVIKRGVTIESGPFKGKKADLLTGFKIKRALAYNPDEARDETGKWTGGGGDSGGRKPADLTKEEKKYFDNWFWPDAGPTNTGMDYSQLRNPKSSDGKKMTALLESMPKYEGTLYRGLALGHDDLKKLTSTSEYEFNLHSSSSTEENEALLFADSASVGGDIDNPVVLEMHGSGRDVREHLPEDLEATKEVVIMAGTRFKLDKVAQKRDYSTGMKYTHVVLKEVKQ